MSHELEDEALEPEDEQEEEYFLEHVEDAAEEALAEEALDVEHCVEISPQGYFGEDEIHYSFTFIMCPICGGRYPRGESCPRRH